MKHIKLTVLARFSYKLTKPSEFLPTHTSLRDLRRRRKAALVDPSLISEVIPVHVLVDKGGIIIDYDLSPLSPLGKGDVELSLVRFNTTATYLCMDTKEQVELKMKEAEAE